MLGCGFYANSTPSMAQRYRGQVDCRWPTWRGALASWAPRRGV